MTKGRVHSTESFGCVDGPGIRFIIFLQGCSMRCAYCHNVDTWDISKACETYTAEELVTKAERYKTYWKDQGGITVSGGEPLLQLDFLIELFSLAKSRGINTCLDTSGQPFTREEPFFSKFRELLQYTDLLLVDIKHINPTCHKDLTGKCNANILDMLQYLSQVDKPVWIRHVLVPGITAVDQYLVKTRQFLDTLQNVKRVDVLPYHTLGQYKWEELGIPYRLEGVDPPSKESVEHAKEILGANN